MPQSNPRKTNKLRHMGVTVYIYIHAYMYINKYIFVYIYHTYIYKVRKADEYPGHTGKDNKILEHDHNRQCAGETHRDTAKEKSPDEEIQSAKARKSIIGRMVEKEENVDKEPRGTGKKDDDNRKKKQKGEKRRVKVRQK